MPSAVSDKDKLTCS